MYFLTYISAVSNLYLLFIHLLAMVSNINTINGTEWIALSVLKCP